jgi:hypothetical protein
MEKKFFKALSFASLAAIILLTPSVNAGTITYVGKDSSVFDFRGLGQHFYYFPAFDLKKPDDLHRTDKDHVYFQGVFKKLIHHAIFPIGSRTFSPDAGGKPLGVKARGGHKSWPSFVLPNGMVGLSGTIYDDYTRSNSNNTINQIIFTKDTPSSFCLNVITDNTNLENIPDLRFEARSDQSEDANVESTSDLTFDGVPDMYTFRYENMKSSGKIKLRMATSRIGGKKGKPITGAGIAGIMVSHISTCAP